MFPGWNINLIKCHITSHEKLSVAASNFFKDRQVSLIESVNFSYCIRILVCNKSLTLQVNEFLGISTPFRAIDRFKRLNIKVMRLGGTCAWYFKSFRIFPVVKFQTSMNPSTDPVTRYWPSGENADASECDSDPNLICRLSCVGYFSSSCSRMAALPRNKSIWVPEKEIEENLR